MTRKFVAALLAGLLVSTNAWAGCVRPEDELAVKTADMQQQLMVAALSCGDVALYNSFVSFHQFELQQSDATLLEFFNRENGASGEADYHAFKTRAANIASLASNRDREAYCANAESLFEAAHDPNLAHFVAMLWNGSGDIVRETCGGTLATARPRDLFSPPSQQDIASADPN
jgi:hypothetical protein